MSETYSTDTIRRVFMDKAGVWVEVGPDSDAGGYPEIRTVGKESIEYFGEIRLPLPPEMALRLGAALIACAQECMKGDGK